MIMLTSRLAGFKCPNCKTLQPYSPVIKTLAIFFVPKQLPKCSNCAAKLWIEEGRGFAQAAVLMILILVFYPMNEMLVALVINSMEPSPLVNILEKWAGTVMIGFVVGFVFYPLSTRVYKVGHTL